MTSLIQAGHGLVFLLRICGSEGSVDDHTTGDLEYIDIVLVEPATDLQGVAVAPLEDNNDRFVEFWRKGASDLHAFDSLVVEGPFVPVDTILILFKFELELNLGKL